VLKQLIVSSIWYLLQAGILLLCMFTSFAVGYFLARPRSQTPSAPLKLDEVETELGFMEATMDKVRAAVNTLLAMENFRSRTDEPRQTAAVFIKRGKAGKIRELFSKLFGAGIEPQFTQRDPLFDRVKGLKQDIRGVATDLRLVINLRKESEGREGVKAGVNGKRDDFGYPNSERLDAGNRTTDFDADSWSINDSSTGSASLAEETTSAQPTIARRSRANTPSEIIDLYNQAVTDNFARERFREVHQPLRVGTVNAVERRQNPTATIEPEFKETTDGDFFAFPMLGANQYAVVPRLGLTIGPVSYHAGALGEMFGNPKYDPMQSYSRYRVRRPAIFKRDGDRWELQSPGELDLGLGD
jgi:hypothetical protein